VCVCLYVRVGGGGMIVGARVSVCVRARVFAFNVPKPQTPNPKS
jgi:hypothetical protein